MSATTSVKPYCGGKLRYETREEARRARLRMRYGSGLEVYRCPGCDGYHLGGRAGYAARKREGR